MREPGGETSAVAPGEPDDDGATILHVDMDAFFASVELAARPGLRGRPVVVGGQERGVVLAATYEARAFGIRSGMPMASALARLPSLVVLPPDHQAYRQVSTRVMAILADVTPQLQQISVDEAFLDVAGARRRLGRPAQIGAAVRARIRDEVGLPASVGVASTMTVAKIASARAKPDGMLVVPKDSTVSFLHQLPVSALWGVGEATEAKLAESGVRTVEELANLPLELLAARLGRASARHLHDLSWGRDPRSVEPVRVEKSISSEHTYAQDVTDREELSRTLLAQCHTVARRLRAGGLLARGVTIKVRHADFTTLTRSRRLDVPSDVAAELHRVSRALLAGVAIPAAGIRLIGARVDDVAPAATTPVQLMLDRDDTAQRAIETALDDVGRRFGQGATTAASLLPTPERSPTRERAGGPSTPTRSSSRTGDLDRDHDPEQASEQTLTVATAAGRLSLSSQVVRGGHHATVGVRAAGTRADGASAQF